MNGGEIIDFYLSASGGNEKFKYATGLGYTDDGGFILQTGYKRISLRSNIDFKLNEKLTLSSKIDLIRSSTNALASERNVTTRSIHIAPTLRTIMPDGSTPGGKTSGWNNPLHIIENNLNNLINLRGSVNVGLDWTPVKDLHAKVNGYYNPSYSKRETFEKDNVYDSRRQSGLYGDLNEVFQVEGIVQYTKEINKSHNFDFIAGSSYLNYGWFDYNVYGYGSSTDKIKTLNAATISEGFSSEGTAEKLVSAFSRLNYDFKSKYLASLSIRVDGSSRFAKGNRTGVFPGLSLGWIASEEEFLQSNSLINTLKLRTSVGQTGNNAVGLYDYQGIYSFGSQYMGQIGVLSTEMANNSLAWEHTNQFDAGFDLGLWKGNRIMLLFDYYTKTTDNLLFDLPLSNTSGYSGIQTNIGQVKFWGYELELSGDIIVAEDFKWNMDFSVSYNMNKVLKLPDNGRDKNRIGGVIFPDGTGIGGIAEGERMFSVVGHKVDFLIDNDEQAANARYDNYAKGYDYTTNTYEKGKKFPGDYEWIDRDGDGDIDSYDRYVLGYVVPTTTGGFSNSIQYKNFNLFVLFDYGLGHVIYDNQISRINAFSIDAYVNPTTDVLEAWKEPGDAANTDFARFLPNDGSLQTNHFRTSDRNAYKGDYLCLREVKFSYQFEKNIVNKLGLNSLNVYVAGNTLVYFTKYPGYVTEYSNGGNNYREGNFPNARIIKFGVNVGL